MKEAYYFPHDCNSIQDPKMMTLLSECGLAGVGAYWVIIEILHQQEWGAIGGPELTQYLSFYGKQGAWEKTLLDKLEKVLFETKLLVLQDGMVTSQRVLNNKRERLNISEIGREYALKRWAKEKGIPIPPHADPMGTHKPPNANKVKESKEKERERDGAAPPPPTQPPAQKAKPQNAAEVTAYAQSIGFALDGNYFWDYQESRGWKVKGGQLLRDWKAAVRTWKRNNLNLNGQSTNGKNQRRNYV